MTKGRQHLFVRTLISLWICSFGALSFAQQDAATENVTVIADTTMQDGRQGATVRLDLHQISLKDLKNLSVQAPDGRELMPKGAKKAYFTVIIPGDLSREDTELTKSVYEEHLRGSSFAESFEVQFDRLDVDDAERRASAGSAQIEAAANAIAATDNNALTLAQRMVAANAYTVKVLKEWRQGFGDRIRKLNKNPESKAMVMGAFIGGASSITPSYFWITETGLNVFGVSQVLIAMVYDQINSTFSRHLIDWEVRHRFPYFAGTRPVSLYNGSKILRSAATNFGVNATFGFTFRTFSWFNNPQAIASPISWDFLSTLGGINLLMAFPSALAEIGVQDLRLKRYISPKTELLINSAFNTLGQMNNSILGAGGAGPLYYCMVGIEAGLKATAGVLGRFLPTKGNRFIVLHPAISPEDHKAIRFKYGVEDAINKEDLTLEKLRGMVEQIPTDVPLTQQWKAKATEAVKIMKIKSGEIAARITKVFSDSCEAMQMLYNLYIP